MPHHDDFRTIDGDVYISPRYLAGTTGIGDPALAPLLDLGWKLEHDDLGNAYLNAPDRRVRLGYLPEGEDDVATRSSRSHRSSIAAGRSTSPAGASSRSSHPTATQGWSSPPAISTRKPS